MAVELFRGLKYFPLRKMAGASGDFRAQATQVFENLKAALTAVGGTFEHLVKLNTDASPDLSANCANAM